VVDTHDLPGNFAGNFVDLGYAAGSGRLDTLNLGRRGLLSQGLDFSGYNSEALARGPGVRGLNGGIERQQIGLRRNLCNGFRYSADQLGRCTQLLRLASPVMRRAFSELHAISLMAVICPVAVATLVRFVLVSSIPPATGHRVGPGGSLLRAFRHLT
jgi:hypothetical protein